LMPVPGATLQVDIEGAYLKGNAPSGARGHCLPENRRRRWLVINL
jgi:hypothetical protein